MMILMTIKIDAIFSLFRFLFPVNSYYSVLVPAAITLRTIRIYNTYICRNDVAFDAVTLAAQPAPDACIDPLY